MARLFLALWLGVFAIQTTDLIAAVAPDGCVEEASGAATDPCPGPCARCICCARVPMATLPLVMAVPSRPSAGVAVVQASASLTSAEPRGIFHVPKDSTARTI